jgi:hypothetical protein
MSNSLCDDCTYTDCADCPHELVAFEDEHSPEQLDPETKVFNFDIDDDEKQ